ncbi:MAG: A/G-specific adenine glycosylase [Blautia sp.]|nr:A/G-specific adenine glycosylase [Lachnoclostridium sp.]MCM1210098.1 A/G-specific adenine glycosylase [Blautia sp.]
MRYHNITEAEFVSRPNRFVAYVNLNGQRIKAHVKNTGRCRELLQEHATVYLEKSGNDNRATAYDLVAVQKEGRIVNVDSNAPNKVVEEWLGKGYLFPDLTLIRPETTYKNSRFDFYLETASGQKIFLEVKGVTLENDNRAAFPDAPSERAVKHVEELIQAKEEGYEAYILFVIQMKGCLSFSPNWETQPVFGSTLQKARRAGVRLLAYDCEVLEDSLWLQDEIPVFLSSLDEAVEPLLAWYDRGRRILPWREEPTPYHVWLSEIMLQQTRVEAVKPYYDRFIRELPDIASLADVEEERLLKLWEGLGYYNRARNLKKTAGQIMADYEGKMPETYEELIKLPGIGSYTAGAISSIAFQYAAPAVDGNVLRVLSRLRLDERDILDTKVKKEIEADLLEVIPKERPGDFNQALMELGAMVCVPNGAARCDKCPWESICGANKAGRIQEFPRKTPKKPRSIEDKTILVIQDENKVALRKRAKKGLLAGMYEFPTMEGHQEPEQVIAYLKSQGVRPLRIEKLPDSKHIFTHKEWHMIGYVIRVDELERMQPSEELLFATPGETEENYPIPSAFAAYTDFMRIRRGTHETTVNSDSEL